MNTGNEMQSSETPTEETPTTSEQTTTTPIPEGTPEEKATSLLEQEKPTEGEKKEEEQAQAVEPLTAEDITFPEDVEVLPELRDEFLSIVNDAEMSQKDRAQALVELQLKAAKQASEASSAAWADVQKTWRDEVKADPEIGGEKLQPSLDKIGRLINEYGSDELLETMALTGAGNNVHVIKFLNKVAEKLTEGGPVVGSPASAPQDAASRMFPSMKG